MRLGMKLLQRRLYLGLFVLILTLLINSVAHADPLNPPPATTEIIQVQAYCEAPNTDNTMFWYHNATNSNLKIQVQRLDLDYVDPFSAPASTPQYFDDNVGFSINIPPPPNESYVPDTDYLFRMRFVDTDGTTGEWTNMPVHTFKCDAQNAPIDGTGINSDGTHVCLTGTCPSDGGTGEPPVNTALTEHTTMQLFALGITVMLAYFIIKQFKWRGTHE